VVGATAVTLVTLGWTRLVRRGEGTEMWPRAAMIGMLIAAVTFALILPVVQDKGLSFAFILLGAPVVRTLVEREPRSRRQEPVLP
jgi:hypothetical protein